MAPPLALGEVPEEVRMNKLLGMNAPPAAKVYSEKEAIIWSAVWKSMEYYAMIQHERRKILISTSRVEGPAHESGRTG